MSVRLKCLRAFFPGHKIDALLVTNAVNIRYLTGFPACDAWLLVTRTQAFYITDFRYVTQAKQGLPRDVKVVQFTVSLFQDVIDLARAHKVRALGIDERQVTMQQFRRLKTIAGAGMSFKVADALVEVLRAVKDEGEIRAIKECIQINHQAYRFIKPLIKPGVSERALLHHLEDFTRQKKVEFSFDPIIASGPNAAFPHARVSDRKLRRGEPLLLDLGIEKNGYKSDLTRMFFLGKMTPSFEKVLSLIKQAQEAAFKTIRPGVKAGDVDAAARSFLAKHGLAKYFGHSLGHGVGLDIHEDPRISQKSGVELQENMVITVEPGVYFPGQYGVRREEMVLVTKNGCEVISDHDQ